MHSNFLYASYTFSFTSVSVEPHADAGCGAHKDKETADTSKLWTQQNKNESPEPWAQQAGQTKLYFVELRLLYSCKYISRRLLLNFVIFYLEYQLRL